MNLKENCMTAPRNLISSNLLAQVGTKIRELWRYREMFQSLVNREMRARYKGSFFGFFWSLLNPLLMMIVYSFVFSIVMRVKVPHYSLYLLSGILPWTWFSISLTNAAGSVVYNSNLIKKIYFPHEILPAVAISTNLINYLLSIPVLIAFMLFQHVPLKLPFLCLPLLLAIQFVFCLGLGLILATLNAYFRDVEQLLGVVLMAWFYITPVLYPVSFIPQGYHDLVMANPMSGLIISYQRIFIEGAWPDPGHLLYGLGAGLVLLIIGSLFFSSRKYDFSEVV